VRSSVVEQRATTVSPLAHASVTARDEMFSDGRRSCCEAAELPRLPSLLEKNGIKFAFVSATLIATTLLASQAMAARGDLAARRAATADRTLADCVRAPSVGAFASAPYSVPPCMPNGAN
jgi:hypothetical protein